MKYLVARKYHPITSQFLYTIIGCIRPERFVQKDVALALQQGEIAAGYTLTGQSRPTSEELEIKY